MLNELVKGTGEVGHVVCTGWMEQLGGRIHEGGYVALRGRGSEGARARVCLCVKAGRDTGVLKNT